MTSMRDIKRRKGSIQSTQKITKAMKLVSTVKLQKAKANAEHSNPYFTYMYQTMTSILAKSGNVKHPYLQAQEGQKAVIAITSNRGLAGGYNSNVSKLILEEGLSKEEVLLYNIGKKGREFLEKRGYTIVRDYSDIMNHPLYADAMEIASDILKEYEEGRVGEIYLAYTSFKNTVSHLPTMLKLLPVELKEEELGKEKPQILMNYEPNEEAVLDQVIPKYVTSLIYGALVEALASENAARMQAMDSATDNAEEMIQDLALKYNRARQGSITQELTEIIAGAEAIGG